MRSAFGTAGRYVSACSFFYFVVSCLSSGMLFALFYHRLCGDDNPEACLLLSTITKDLFVVNKIVLALEVGVFGI